MKVIETRLPGVMLIEPRVFTDARGFFFETWNRARYHAIGLPAEFVQDNLSCSTRGTLRGLHFQRTHPQGKLVSILQGEVFDVAVDIRIGSPTFAQWVGAILSSTNKRQLYIPPDFAHGFCVLSEQALVAYKCSDGYHPDSEGGVLWNDPNIAIDWPVRSPLLSAKDQGFPLLHDISPQRLPLYGG